MIKERIKMRKIKFRVWDNDLKKWYRSNQLVIRPYSGYVSDGAIVPNVELSQYTGFKDKQGKEVYEHDIIKEEDGFLWVVKFENGSWVVEGGEYGMTEHLYEFANKTDVSKIIASVVGNLYENPEMLL
jgi:uncharacterized phage protein (TIGR01671 family)